MNLEVIASQDYKKTTEDGIDISQGEIYAVEEIKDELFLVRGKNGVRGWAPGIYLTVLNNSEEGAKEKCGFCKKEVKKAF